jgi:hypothetical protein
MALKYAPTMVIGLEDGSGNDEMAKVLEDVRFGFRNTTDKFALLSGLEWQMSRN